MYVPDVNNQPTLHIKDEYKPVLAKERNLGSIEVAVVNTLWQADDSEE